MANSFTSPDGDLENLYITDYNLIDRYVTTGSLWIVGQNIYGTLGDNTITKKSSPIQTIAGGTNWKQVSTNSYGVGAIKTDGTLWVWGQNSYGELGTNNTTDRSSPVQTVSGGTNWYQVFLGRASAGIKTDGTLWLWGRNTFGGLGDNTTSNRSSPVQTVAAGNTWKKIGLGQDTSAAIKTDGTLWLWGRNLYGTIGNNTSSNNYSSPVQTVAGGTNWKDVCITGDTTVAIKTDGTLWTWGYNAQGQLGNNNTTNCSSPVQTIAAGTNWKAVGCGYGAGGSTICATKTDGTLWLWGSNSYGQIGDNTTTARSSPVQTVAGGTNWKQAWTSSYFSCGIKTDGTLWVWGWNGQGGLGVNDTTSRSSPVQNVASGSNWKQVSAGSGGVAGIYFYDAGNLYPSA